MSSSTLPGWQRGWYSACRWGWRVFFQALGGLEVRGLENLPAQGPMILAPNHVSLMDPWVMCAASPNPLRSLAAEYLFRNPCLRAWLYSMGAFPLKQNQPDPQAMAQARQFLQRGATLMVFPEGGCSPDGLPRPWLPGVSVLALRSGAPVVPVVIAGSRKLLPLGHLLPRPHPVSVTFLSPVATTLHQGPVKPQVLALTQRLEQAWQAGFVA